MVINMILPRINPMSENMKDFREWLVFSINSARFVPDAIDPKAADILENVLERFDEYAKSTNIKLTLPNPPNPQPACRLHVYR
jgi:hypothetical protein